MFNSASSNLTFNNWKILGGVATGDYATHRTLYAGPDPADPDRLLVRKLVQTSENAWAFEEATITPNAKGKKPTIHTTMYRLGWQDVNSKIDDTEYAMRLMYRPVPNVVGFSLFSRPCKRGALAGSSFTIVENQLEKRGGTRWLEWFKDLQDRRDIASYLKTRWWLN